MNTQEKTETRLKLDSYPQLMSGLSSLPEQERKKHLRHLARTDLYFLLRYLLNRYDIEHPWLFERCREVEADPNGHLDLWAREHYKSTIITFGKTIQDILASHGDYPVLPEELTFGLFSHTRPLAKGFLRQIKSEFERNDVLKELFPDILWSDPKRNAPKWSEDDGISVKRKGNPKEQTIEAWGVVDGQPIGKHFKVLLYDDIVVPASVTNPDQMAKTLESLQNSYNLGAEGGTKRFIGTRYHFNDAYRSIIDAKTVVPRIYPATEDGTPTGEPVLLTRERIAEKRREQGPYIFGCQLLLNPQADETQGFQPGWLKYYDNVTYKGLNIYILCDPANEKKKDNDYTVVWVIGLGPDHKARVLEVVRDRLNLTERTNLIMDLHKKYTQLCGLRAIQEVRYEKYGKDADINHIEEVQERENYKFEITEVGGSTPKNDRIRRLVPKFESGDILLPRTQHYTDYTGKTVDLVQTFINEEYKAFPVPLHDDMLDGLARLYEPKLTLKWPRMKTQREEGFGSGHTNHGPAGWMGA